jgi:hypothetical protein
MSLIVAEVYDALIEAGTSEEKAKAAAGAIPVAKSLLTKEDLDGLKEGIDKRFAKIEERFAKIDERFAKIDERFVKMDERFVKIERDLAVLKFGYGPVILALLVKIAFFS